MPLSRTVALRFKFRVRFFYMSKTLMCNCNDVSLSTDENENDNKAMVLENLTLQDGIMQSAVFDFTDGQDGDECNDPILIEPLARNGRIEVGLLKTIINVQTKVEWKMECRRILGRKVCTKIPKIYKRDVYLEVYATIRHPTLDQLKKDIELCVKVAVAAALAVGLATGNYAAAAKAFQGALVTCLKTRGVDRASEIKVDISDRTTKGRWRPA